MKNKKILKVILSTCIVLIFLGVTVYCVNGRFGPVNYEPFVCTGGYMTDVSHAYRETFEDLIGREITEDERSVIRENLHWDGRDIFTEFTDKNENTYKFEGRKKWYFQYEWRLANEEG